MRIDLDAHIYNGGNTPSLQTYVYGNIYVTDREENKLQAYEFERRIGIIGPKDTETINPHFTIRAQDMPTNFSSEGLLIIRGRVRSRTLVDNVYHNYDWCVTYTDKLGDCEVGDYDLPER